MNEIYPIEITQGETREKGEVLILEEKMDKDSSSLINDTLYLNSKTNKFQIQWNFLSIVNLKMIKYPRIHHREKVAHLQIKVLIILRTELSKTQSD